MSKPFIPPFPAHLMGVHSHTHAGYAPLVDYASWRVALLNYSPELNSQALLKMQRHNETDEVFVILQGKCLLLLGDGDMQISALFGELLQPGSLYNVRKGVWHNHVLSRDAKVLVVENRNTTFNNSPFLDLTQIQSDTLLLWARDMGLF